ncbi:MAG TPA: diaminobutyrate acetyltransferase [Mariprofundaceae bacterium]|nr:diaminobutyrate acetyltransferase [Mariprofundaceae bacterium]
MLSDQMKQVPSIAFRKPTVEDGPSIFDLVNRSKPLDVNSRYLYLLQCSHFANTCAVAESDGSVQAFISAYVRPDQPDTLFVWQVAVDSSLRGKGVASILLAELLGRPYLAAIRFVEATVNPSNNASRGLFASLARKLDCPLMENMLFEAELLNDGTNEGAHEAEILLCVGPIKP